MLKLMPHTTIPEKLVSAVFAIKTASSPVMLVRIARQATSETRLPGLTWERHILHAKLTETGKLLLKPDDRLHW